jgi:hypothetical protein
MKAAALEGTRPGSRSQNGDPGWWRFRVVVRLHDYCAFIESFVAPSRADVDLAVEECRMSFPR